jgi:hypothetical protein
MHLLEIKNGMKMIWFVFFGKKDLCDKFKLCGTSWTELFPKEK